MELTDMFQMAFYYIHKKKMMDKITYENATYFR